MNARYPRTLPIDIVGGGIAGLSLGIGLLNKGISVRLFEASSYPRHRMCGEFMNGVSKETLSALGTEDILTDALKHSQTRWFRNGKQVHAAELPRPALAISRHELDLRLADRFRELGGDLVENFRKKPDPSEGLVWATGRPIQKKEGKGPRRWVGLKCHARGLQVSGDLEMHMGASAYVGLTPIGGGRVNICGLFPAGVTPSPDEDSNRMVAMLKAHGFSELASSVTEAEVINDSITGAAGFSFGPQEPITGICPLGDAGAIIPPFTGNGMSMAFEAAESALVPLEAYARGELPWTETCSSVADLLQKRFRTRLRVSRMLHPLMLNSVGQRVLTGALRARLVPFRYVHSLLT